ncbi:MAG: isochorismate synthase [Planctomycetales bacterium]|nr:isochorismate synthase [Planctomycetales bacterium]
MVDTTIPTRTSGHNQLQSLKEQLRSVTSFPAQVKTDSRLPAGTNVSDWLAAQPFETKVLWSDRESSDTVVGAGLARRLVADSSQNMDDVVLQCRQILADSTDLRFYGGFSFRRDEHVQSRKWRPFRHAQFVLPRFTHDGTTLSCTVMDEKDFEQAEQDIDSLETSVTSLSPSPKLVQRVDLPSKADWQANIEDAIELFESEIVEKVVLARRADFTFDRPLSPIRLVQRLMAATTACYHFCFQLDHGTAFVGATPERLIKRHGSRLLSEVVAGTRPRGLTESEDRRLAQELLSSAKDQLEHDIVRKSIRQRLHKYVNALEVDSQASLLKLARKQHLYSGVRATLKDGVSDGELLERLHPTPAVGGYPTENALAEIARIEQFDRGWYAAPIGWITSDAAEFAVAIRSGLVSDRELSLYSGAGIVPGSKADEEWCEIEHKIRDFLDVMQTS